MTSLPFYRTPIIAWVLGLTVIAIDQGTKWLIQQRMPLNTVLIPIESWHPYFQFTHIANTGTVFGLFPNASWLFTILAIIVSVTLIVVLHTTPTQNSLFFLAIGMLFGGAIGNLTDRLRIGYVVDFLDVDVSSLVNLPFADWAVFNVADMALVSGIIMLAIYILVEPAPTTEDDSPSFVD